MKLIVRLPAADRLKVLDFNTQEEARERMVELYSRDNTLQFYRVIDQSPDFLLRRLRPVPGSVVTEPKVIDVVFEDDV